MVDYVIAWNYLFCQDAAQAEGEGCKPTHKVEYWIPNIYLSYFAQ